MGKVRDGIRLFNYQYANIYNLNLGPKRLYLNLYKLQKLIDRVFSHRFPRLNGKFIKKTKYISYVASCRVSTGLEINVIAKLSSGLGHPDWDIPHTLKKCVIGLSN